MIEITFQRGSPAIFPSFPSVYDQGIRIRIDQRFDGDSGKNKKNKNKNQRKRVKIIVNLIR